MKNIQKRLSAWKEKATLSIAVPLSMVAMPAVADVSGGPNKSKLPTVYQGMDSGGDLIGTIWGLAGKFFLLVGLILSAGALIVVAQSLIAEFGKIGTGKSDMARLGGLAAVGIVLVVAVVFFVTKAIDMFS